MDAEELADDPFENEVLACLNMLVSCPEPLTLEWFLGWCVLWRKGDDSITAPEMLAAIRRLEKRGAITIEPMFDVGDQLEDIGHVVHVDWKGLQTGRYR